MRVLLIGSGGREHALAWAISASPLVDGLFCAPGNAGIADVATCVDLNGDDHAAVIAFCKSRAIDLVVVGPEAPLVAGLTDALRAATDLPRLKVFGPCQEAAQLEADKAFSKALMRSAAIPTAEARTFDNAEAALAYVEAHETPVVVKAAGLAKGKGVIVTDSAAEAADAVRQIMISREFGEAGETIIVEERLIGQEVSILALVDGRNIYVLEPSQDHKQVGEGDTGPNTGGMGAYTPTPLVDDALMRVIDRQVLVPTIDALRRDRIEFKGVLYAGLMLTAGGPKVLEFNVRFGDPECQPLMVRMKGDLLETMLAVCDGTLDKVDIDWDRRVACCVVVCSGGYPGPYEKGLPITGLDEAAKLDDVYVFHAGTKKQGGEVVTAGGRVLNVVALGGDLAEARDRANEACDLIRFDGAFFRRDIGDRVLRTSTK